jgi:hypothetical protein
MQVAMYAPVSFIALMLLAAVPAVAKTDQMGNPGNETDGVYVTGITDTTNYQDQAPIVTRINGAPAQQGLPTPPPATPEERGHAYDEYVRKGMPLTWFVCKTSSDCILGNVICGTSFAVGRAHKTEAEEMFCSAHKCVPACLATAGSPAVVQCKNSECVTIIPY